MFQRLPTEKQKKTFNVAYCAILAAFLFVFSLFDFVFNFNFGVPGVKMGFSNIVIIFSIYTNGFFLSFVLILMKIIINTFVLGGFSSFVFTFFGSVAGFLAMYFIKKLLGEKVSCIGVSVAGGFFHIVMQYVASFFIMKSVAVFSLLPYAVILSLISSIIVGIISDLIIKRWFKK